MNEEQPAPFDPPTVFGVDLPNVFDVGPNISDEERQAFERRWKQSIEDSARAVKEKSDRWD